MPALKIGIPIFKCFGYTFPAECGKLLPAKGGTPVREEILKYLRPTEIVGREIRYFSELDSTNTRAKILARTGAPEGTAVIAGRQTAGRGRMARSFQSPAEKGLYLTVLLRPQLPPERLTPVTALAGEALCDAVGRLCGLRPGLKWPNDPVLNGRKLCGILTERTGDGALVLGIGVNVSQRASDFSPEVAELATSLEMELGRPVSRAELAAALLEELDDMYQALLSGDLSAYLEAYRRDCVNLGRQVQLITPDGDRETAQALDVDREFGLVVRDAAGRRRTVRSGEVSVRGLYGYVDAPDTQPGKETG